MPTHTHRSPWERAWRNIRIGVRRARVSYLKFTQPVLGPFRRRWKTSLRLRMLTITGAATVLMIGVSGTVLLTVLRDDLVSTNLEQALEDSARATVAAQQRIDSSDAFDRAALSSLMSTVRGTIRDTSSSSLMYVRQQPGQRVNPDSPQSFTTDPEFVNAISAELSTEVLTHEAPQLWQFTELRDPSGQPQPGVIVATSLEMPAGAGTYDLFIGYSFGEVQQSLGFIQRTLLSTTLILILLVASLVWIIARVVFKPIRAAAEASRLLAAGESDARMPYQNDEYFDVLSDNFNEMADTLNARIDELDTLSTMQQRFVSDVSHELRTPLTTIRLASEVLSSATDLPPAQTRAIKVLGEQIDRFESLLADLLEISRYDAGRVHLETEPTSLISLIGAIIQRLQPLSESVIELRPLGGYGEIEVDPRRVRRIVSNLIENAIEHGEGRPIIVTVDSNSSAFAVAVRDYGIGMNEEQIANVFNRFWRGDPSRKRTLGGTGLGLAIAQEDAAAHGGIIDVWSEPGIGTNFRLTLPRSDDDTTYLSPLPLIPQEFTSSGDTKTTGGWLKRPMRWLSRGARAE